MSFRRYRCVPPVAALVLGLLLPACGRGAETLVLSKGVFHWVNHDGEPNRTWTLRGKMVVKLTDKYAIADHNGMRVVIPRERLVYVADNTDPGAWK